MPLITLTAPTISLPGRTSREDPYANNCTIAAILAGRFRGLRKSFLKNRASSSRDCRQWMEPSTRIASVNG